VDFSLTFLGIWENTHTSRLLTGLLLGAVTVFYIVPGIVELSTRLGRTKTDPNTTPRFTAVTAEAIGLAPSDYRSPERRV
jgi:hypothetical protein